MGFGRTGARPKSTEMTDLSLGRADLAEDVAAFRVKVALKHERDLDAEPVEIGLSPRSTRLVTSI